MKFNKDDIAALVGTIIVHMILFLILYLCVLRTIVPNEDSGILVNFGEISASTGTFEPQYAAASPQEETLPPPNPKPVPKAEEEVITQDEEETIKIPDKKNKKENKKITDEKAKKDKTKEDEKRKKEAEIKRRQEEQRKREEAISNRVSNAFGMGNSQSSNHGDATSGTSNQGSPFGNSDSGANTGTGGYGSFNLNGRSIGRGGLPKPSYTVQEEGKIVINITVDPNGNVILAEIGRGTNIDNATLRRSAIDAAKRAKFNKIAGTNNQNGTITYIYKLN